LTARAEAALAPYRETQKDFPGTSAARWARLGEANALMDQGKVEQALKGYDEVAREAEGFLQYAALEGAGFALEGQEKYADAVARFEQAGNVAQGVYKPASEYQAGRLLALSGKRDEAIARLEALLEAAQERVGDEQAGVGPEFDGVKADAETLLRELGAAPKKGLNIDLGRAREGGGMPDMDALRKLVEAQLQNNPASDTTTAPVETEPPSATGDGANEQAGAAPTAVAPKTPDAANPDPKPTPKKKPLAPAPGQQARSVAPTEAVAPTELPAPEAVAPPATPPPATPPPATPPPGDLTP
jgi:tetratricopeptide (TPR) repeat protein